MKRIYIAVVFLILCFAVGSVEFITINSNVNNYLDKIEKTSALIQRNEIKKAESLLKETALSFDKYSKNVLYCYYRHDHLEEITDDLYTLEDILDDKRIEDYHEKSHLLMKKLLSLKEKEHITIQNIL